MNPIPVNTPLLKGNELKYLTECIETSWISSEGPFIHKFERQFSSYINRRHGIAVSSGSAALDIAVRALGIGKGDEVIMPTFTIISPAQSVINAGAIPILVDCDPLTWNMDVSQIEAKITANTKAIIVVHIYGLPIDMNPILALAKNYHLKVIEDAAEVHGQTYKGKRCGSFGDITTFSFYANKNITCGEGGMLLTNDDALAAQCKKLRNLAFETNGKRFVHEELGWNYRMTNMQAAVGIAQLEQIEEFLNIKKTMGSFYQQELSFLKEKGFQLPLQSTSYAENVYWVFGIVCPTEDIYVDLLMYLQKNQIGTRPFFWCMHEQPVFNRLGLFKNESYPIAEKLARKGFYLPSGLGLATDELAYIVKIIKNYFV